jgi:phage host-nuclease inhibitor protein Gam
MATQDDQVVEISPNKTPRGRNKADEMLAQIGDSERQARMIEAQRDAQITALNAQIEAIKQEADNKIERLAINIERRLPALWRWYRGNLKRYGRGQRTIYLPSGTIGMKLDSARSVEVTGDMAEVVKAVRRRGLRFIKIKVELNKAAIAQEWRRFRNVPGLTFHLYDRFFAEPLVLKETTKPKESRLRIPVRDTHR